MGAPMICKLKLRIKSYIKGGGFLKALDACFSSQLLAEERYRLLRVRGGLLLRDLPDQHDHVRGGNGTAEAH